MIRHLIHPALFAVGLGAQVQIQVFAHTDLQVGQQRIVAGSDISAGANLRWSNNDPQSPAWAAMSVTAGASTVRFDNAVGASATAPPTIGGAIRVRLSSPTPLRGTLRIDGLAVSASAFRVDVGNDGSFELASTLAPVVASSILEQTLTIPATGLNVVMFGSAAANYMTFAGSSTLELSFAPTGANATRSGDACGADLTAQFYREPLLWQLNRRFELSVDNAPVTPHAFFVIGTTPQNVVIPPLGCILRTDILVPLLTTVDPTGRAFLTLAAPEVLTAFDARVQFIAATLDAQNNALWRTSEVVRIQF